MPIALNEQNSQKEQQKWFGSPYRSFQDGCHVTLAKSLAIFRNFLSAGSTGTENSPGVHSAHVVFRIHQEKL